MKKNIYIGINGLFALPFLGVLLTVFIVNNDMAEGVVTGKYAWFYFSMPFVMLSACLFVVLKRSHFRFGILDFLFFLTGITILFTNKLIHHSEANTKYYLLGLLLCLYLFVRFLNQGNHFFRPVFLLFLIVTVLVEAIVGLAQLYGFAHSQHSFFKMTGTFFNPGPYAGYLAMLLPAAFFYVLSDYRVWKFKKNRRLIFYYFRWIISVLAMILGLLVVPATMSRAAWLALAGGCACVLIVFLCQSKRFRDFYQKWKNITKFLIPVILFTIILAMVGMYYMKKDSADGRGLIWKTSLQLIRKHPLGVGLGNFSGMYGLEQADYFASGQASEQEMNVAGNPEYGFNEYLQGCAEWGIPAFLLFLSLIIYSLYRAIKQKQTAIASALVSLMIFALFSYPFSVLPFLIVLICVLACIEDKKNISTSTIYLSKVVYSIRVFTVILISVGAGLILLWKAYPSIEASRRWHNAQYFYNTGQQDIAVKEYRKLYPLLSDRIKFLFEYGQSLAKSKQYKESNLVLEKAVKLSCDPMLYNIMGKNYQGLKDYQQAEECFILASHIVPSRIYPYYLLAKLYSESGERAKALQMAEHVLSKDPKVKSDATDEMKKEMRLYR